MIRVCRVRRARGVDFEITKRWRRRRGDRRQHGENDKKDANNSATHRPPILRGTQPVTLTMRARQLTLTALMFAATVIVGGCARAGATSVRRELVSDEA